MAPPVKFFLATSLTAFCGTFQMCYYAGVINIPQRVFMQIINETNVARSGSPMPISALTVLWGWIVSIQMIGAFFGSLVTPYFAERFGRKMTLLVLSNSIAIGSCVLMCLFQLAHSYEMLAVGRFVSGFSGGMSVSLLPVYLSECSPVEWRGFMGNLQNFLYNLVYIIAYVVGMPSACGNAENVPFLLGIGLVPAVIQLVSAFFIPESPKYLYMKRKDIVATEESLNFWYGSRMLDFKQIFKNYDEEAHALDHEVGFIRAMKIPCFRRIMVTSIIVWACVQTCGIGPIFAYSTGMFLKLGLDTQVSAMCTDMLAVANTVGAFVIIPFMAKFPRRPCYFISYGILIGTLLIYIAFAVLHDHTSWMWSSYVAVSSIYAFAIVYNLGGGALSFIIPSEISPQAIRSTVMSVSSAISWLLGLLWTFLYPPLETLMGPWNFFVSIVPLIFGLIYLYKTLPETRTAGIVEILRQYSSVDDLKKPFEEQKDNYEISYDSNGIAAAPDEILKF